MNEAPPQKSLKTVWLNETYGSVSGDPATPNEQILYTMNKHTFYCNPSKRTTRLESNFRMNLGNTVSKK